MKTADTIIHFVNITTTAFTAAVLVYSSLNFLMYYQVRREIDNQRAIKDTLRDAVKKEVDLKHRQNQTADDQDHSDDF